jgi:protein SCO1
MMSRQMRQIQAQSNTVRMVSFSVDPVNDTPAALTAYAANFKPDFTRWRFLTGDQQRLNDMALNVFKLNGVDGSMNHSTRFALVDRRRRIRGYYINSEEGFMTKVMHDIRQLEREGS